MAEYKYTERRLEGKEKEEVDLLFNDVLFRMRKFDRFQVTTFMSIFCSEVNEMPNTEFFWGIDKKRVQSSGEGG